MSVKIRISNRYATKVRGLRNQSIAQSDFIGLQIPAPARVSRFLCSRKGLGPSSSDFLILSSGLGRNVRALDLKGRSRQFDKNAEDLCFSNSIFTGSIVKRLRMAHVSKMKKNSSYRGFRHFLGLPVRGQRTCSNSKTRKKYKII